MDPILEQIYATILPSAPYVIAAYALMWGALLVYVIYATVRMKKVESQIAVLQNTLDKATSTKTNSDFVAQTQEVQDESESIKKK